VLHPRLEVVTGAARGLLGEPVPLRDAVRQWGNLGGLVSGLFLGDLALIARSLDDAIAEPKRAALVPGFYTVKQAALDAGALGCSLSGSGPSLFALCASLEGATRAGDAMRVAFAAGSGGVDADVWISPVGRQGARIVASPGTFARS
jgi:homoserine kinase